MEHKTNPARGKVLWTLFSSILSISACTFGGGFVIVTLMRKRFLDELGWLEEEEMLDMTALAQSCPGAIAVNAAIALGWRMAGFWGMVVSVLGAALPPMVILSVLSAAYGAFADNRYVALTLRGMQAGVAAVITDVVITLVQKEIKSKSPLRILLMPLCFAAVFFLKINVVYVILAVAVLGVVTALLKRRKEAA